MENLIRILKEVRPDVDFENEKELVDGKVLDSFDIIAIVNALDEEYMIEIDIEDLEPENFNTVEAIYELIERLS